MQLVGLSSQYSTFFGNILYCAAMSESSSNSNSLGRISVASLCASQRVTCTDKSGVDSGQDCKASPPLEPSDCNLPDQRVHLRPAPAATHGNLCEDCPCLSDASAGCVSWTLDRLCVSDGLRVSPPSTYRFTPQRLASTS